MVFKWRGRLALRGIDGPVDLPRAGCPRRITDAQRLQLIALACEPAQEGCCTTPNLDGLIARAVERGVVDRISRRHLRRILEAGDLHPHRVREWLHGPDPGFKAKVNEICELYRKPPAGTGEPRQTSTPSGPRWLRPILTGTSMRLGQPQPA